MPALAPADVEVVVAVVVEAALAAEAVEEVTLPDDGLVETAPFSPDWVVEAEEPATG